ncbi:hypothetical protein SAMN06297144_1561 [Sphingomonas guangdongensis]|uniref:Uncharacterized protein n=1 Tax=Sphingomonas guangdongensis TaxID=1141890 RepID=A0A285QXA4_9SPHN|nr:hypothetical protein [Sphingomonas guangdongensis]SOB86456.1 hypothetical protein SAMN06297144_1561 [Sphingomonas guangdongensis]
MAEQPGVPTSRFLVGIMLGAALALIALAVWMIATDRGSPVFVAVAGSMLASFAAIVAAQAKKTKG